MKVKELGIALGIVAAVLHVVTEGESTLFWLRALRGQGRLK